MALRTGFDISVTGPSGEDIRDDLREVQEKLADLSHDMPRAAVRAINETLKGTKTEMSQAIRSVYNFKAKAINKRLSISRANIKKMGGYVRSKGGQIHLTDLLGTTQLKKGVKVQVKKTSGSTVIPSAFISGALNSGKLIVLRRPSKGPGERFARYGRPGTGGLWTIKHGLKGRDARLEWFMVAHPEYLYNSKIVWKKVVGGIKIRVDKNIKNEIDAEFRRLKGEWG